MRRRGSGRQDRELVRLARVLTCSVEGCGEPAAGDAFITLRPAGLVVCAPVCQEHGLLLARYSPVSAGDVRRQASK